MVEEATHIVVSRQLLSDFSKGVKSLADDKALDVCGTHAVGGCEERVRRSPLRRARCGGD